MAAEIIQNNDQKLNKFYLAVNHYAEEQRQRIEDEVELFKKKELDDAEVGVLTEAYRLIQKEMDQMRSGISREMARRSIDERRALLARRQEISAEVFARAQKELLAFSATPGYAAWLCARAKSLSAAFSQSGTVLMVKPSDLSHAAALSSAFGGGCTGVEADPEILLGGVRAVNASRGIVADSTLDALLNDQHEWFEEHSGMSVV